MQGIYHVHVGQSMPFQIVGTFFTSFMTSPQKRVRLTISSTMLKMNEVRKGVLKPSVMI